MKPILVVSILFCAIALPAVGELTDADLDKIRLIVKEEVKAEIAGVRQEIAGVKQELKAEIASVEQELKAEIAASEKRTKEYIDLKVDALDQKIDAVEKKLYARIDDIRIVMIALIGLIAAAVALPQFIIAYTERKREREIHLLIDQLREKNGVPPASS